MTIGHLPTRYQVEQWSDVLPEMKPLWPEHWEESAILKDKSALDPDLDRYADMATKGVLHLITARKGDALVGYQVWMTGTQLHHRTVVAAYTDMYWLRKDCRLGFTAVRMFRCAEQHLKSVGVTKIFSTTRPWLDIGRIFEWLGWQKTETVYCKYVGAE